MILLLLLISVAFAVIVYRSGRHSPRMLGPAAGVVLFVAGWGAFHEPRSGSPSDAPTKATSSAAQPVIAPQANSTTAQPAPSPDPAPDLSDRTRQLIWIEESKDGIRARLKDPDSANFKGVFFSKFENIPMVCGQVNSKNSFGGYSGYQRFIASGKGVDILQDDMEPAEFAKSWKLMCAGASR